VFTAILCASFCRCLWAVLSCCRAVGWGGAGRGACVKQECGWQGEVLVTISCGRHVQLLFSADSTTQSVEFRSSSTQVPVLRTTAHAQGWPPTTANNAHPQTMSALQYTLARLGHIATRAQLVAEGFHGFALTAAVRGGEIARIRRGWYRNAEANLDAVAAVRVGGRLSHSSAARSLGLWSGLDTRLHVCVTRGASRLRRPTFLALDDVPGRAPDSPSQVGDARVDATTPSSGSSSSPSGLVVHWLRPGRQDLRSHETWRVSLYECLRQMVAVSDSETAIACLDTAITTFGLTRQQLHRAFAGEPKRSRELAQRARGGSDSGLESIVRQRLESGGIPFRQQVSFTNIGRVDFVIDKALVVEIDGWAFHKSPDSFEADRRRDALLTERGLTVLRFSYLQVVEDWRFVDRVIRNTRERRAPGTEHRAPSTEPLS
jgi:very-short-patch-repair endonuclease